MPAHAQKEMHLWLFKEKPYLLAHGLTPGQYVCHAFPTERHDAVPQLHAMAVQQDLLACALHKLLRSQPLGKVRSIPAEITPIGVMHLSAK